MKKFLSLSAACALSFTTLHAMDAEVQKELEMLRQQVKELTQKVDDNSLERMTQELGALKKSTLGDHLKFKADYRFTIDSVKYDHADGTETENGDFMSNRLILRGEYAPRDDLSFITELAYNKHFGDTANHQQSNTNPGYADFDWVTNETATDNEVKIKEAYFIYFGNIADTVKYTASIGRRPSVGGLPINLREDDKAASPLAHGINVEFDGASFRFDLDKLTGVSGMYFKICLGRGLTNASPRFTSSMAAQGDYAADKNLQMDTDLYGFIFQPWSDGQYTVMTSLYRAENMIGFSQSDIMRYQLAGMGMDVSTDESFNSNMMAYQNYMMTGDMSSFVPNSIDPAMQPYYAMSFMPGFQDLGGYTGGAVTVFADGVGDMINDFLDDTKLFASYAFSQTDPDDGKSMLGSTDSEFGYSWWVGAQIPCLLTDDGRLGFEYNHGSKYWRSVTHAEDTVAGSKIATRGDAYEVYWIKPILGYLTAELRYTRMEYDYTGSNAFFGDEGTPYDIDSATAKMMGAVESASDFRAMIRYRY